MDWYWPILRCVPRQQGGGDTHLDFTLGAASSIIWLTHKVTEKYCTNWICNVYTSWQLMKYLKGVSPNRRTSCSRITVTVQCQRNLCKPEDFSFIVSEDQKWPYRHNRKYSKSNNADRGLWSIVHLRHSVTQNRTLPKLNTRENYLWPQLLTANLRTSLHSSCYFFLTGFEPENICLLTLCF